MALPDFTMKQLLEAGVHFGHKTRRWNPKMAAYIYGKHNNIHIINLAQTVALLRKALQVISDVVEKGGRVLFVGTKKQSSGYLADSAKRCAQYYVNYRWLGGTLTNWKTVSASISKLVDVENKLADGAQGFTKKERLMFTRTKDKLEKKLGGIRDMRGVPDLLVILDTNKERLAVDEACSLGIPKVAIVDTNSNPDNIEYPIPGNDDASNAIRLYCDLFADAVIHGIAQSQSGIELAAKDGQDKEVQDNNGQDKANKAKDDATKAGKDTGKDTGKD